MRYPVSFSIAFSKHKYPGKLIAIEGIDGCGKTTQAQEVVKALQKKKIKAVYTKEPTDEPTGKLIREVLEGKITVPPLSLQYLFCADRGVHQVELESYLKKGYVVITDRYFWSAVAYGISDLKGKPDYYLAAFSILSLYHQFMSPDYTFFLDVSVDTAYERIKKSSKHSEIYDKKEKLGNIRKGYNVLLERFQKEFTVVDGERAVDEVLVDLVERIEQKIT